MGLQVVDTVRIAAVSALLAAGLLVVTGQGAATRFDQTHATGPRLLVEFGTAEVAPNGPSAAR